MKKLVAMVLVVLTGASGVAQQAAPLSSSPPPLSAKGAAVKRKADSLALHARVSVVRVRAAEEYGTFVSSDAAGFTFYDVDQKTNVTLSYGEVKKIKDGYGGYNSVQHRHTDHTKGVVISAIVIAGLAGLIVLATADK